GGGAPMSFPFSMGQQPPPIRASSDDFSNSVIVNAPSNRQLEVEALIEEIDQQTQQPQATRVFKLDYAVATEVLPVVQGVLQANSPRGRGGPSAQGNRGGGGGGFFGFLFGGGNAQQQGTATADDRTNTIVVTTIPDNITLVETVLKELDTEVPVASTTFVFPLQNARADAIAELMQSAFGNRQAGGNFNRGGGFNQGRTGQNTRNNNTNRNRNTGGGGGGGGGFGRGVDEEQAGPDGVNLSVDPDGNITTDVFVQQGGFRGGFFGQQGGTRQQSGLVRGSDGRVINQRDLTGQVTAIPDPNTNSLIVVTTPDNIDLIRQVLDQLDRVPEQVMIETIIVEATLDKTDKLGIEWAGTSNNLAGNQGVTGTGRTDFGLQNATPALQGFRYTVTGGNITGFMNALATDDKFEILSTPRIFTSNNVAAQINISQAVPFILSTRTDTNGAQTFNYSFQDVGIVLDVTPRITSNGYVTMDVSQTANDLQGFTDFNAPIVNQRQAETTVSVKDGETIVLGGIMRSTVTSRVKKLPILGDIPILGQLFRSTDRQNQKTELLVFLRPVIVRDEDQARSLRENTSRQLSPDLQRKLNQNIQNQATAATGKNEKTNKPPTTQP
ncbi:MAG: hypothetical protein MH204_06745, partial [Fimbriimonadaceae bacterium]|nr:hypothetical protein [Fimbriimonadaceae bacterium]